MLSFLLDISRREKIHSERKRGERNICLEIVGWPKSLLRFSHKIQNTRVNFLANWIHSKIKWSTIPFVISGKSKGVGWPLEWGHWVFLKRIWASQHCISIRVWGEWWNSLGSDRGWKEWPSSNVEGHGSLSVYSHQIHHVLKTQTRWVFLFSSKLNDHVYSFCKEKEKKRVGYKALVFVEDRLSKTQYVWEENVIAILREVLLYRESLHPMNKIK